MSSTAQAQRHLQLLKGKRAWGYLDIVVFGSSDDQVMVACSLIHRETHHRPNVPSQLPDRLQSTNNSTRLIVDGTCL